MLKYILLFCLIFSAAGIIFADDSVETITHDGIDRSYYLHLPPNYEEADSLPLLIGLHPSASSGKAMAILTGLDIAGDEQGFISVFPNSSGVSWNDGRDSLESDIDDTGYLTTLIDELAENYKVDTEKITLVGWGGGGLMAYSLACQMPEKFESVAVVGALMWDEMRENCTPDLPVKMLVIHGKDDWFYHTESYEYSHPADPSEKTPLLGIEDTLAIFANGCEISVDENIYTSECGLAAYDVAGAKQNWPRASDYLLNQAGVDATEMVMNFFTGAEWAVEQPDVDLLARNYTVYVPNSYDPAEPTPIVLALHGRFQTMASMANMSDWNVVAEENQVIVVYPEGINLEWNYMHGMLNSPEDNYDDAEFLDMLVKDLAKDLNIDEQRIYVAGFSNGGFMVHRLACEVPDRYAAYASVAGSSIQGFEMLCGAEASVNMLIIHGTADNNIPWNGMQQNVNGRMIYVTLPISGLFAYWGNHAGCDPETYEVEDLPELGNSPGTSVRVIRLTDCPNNEELLLYAVMGGGHNWPGYERLPSYIAGTVNLDISATEVIQEFFLRHTRDEP